MENNFIEEDYIYDGPTPKENNNKITCHTCKFCIDKKKGSKSNTNYCIYTKQFLNSHKACKYYGNREQEEKEMLKFLDKLEERVKKNSSNNNSSW